VETILSIQMNFTQAAVAECVSVDHVKFPELRML